jgi:hypothetical protein
MGTQGSNSEPGCSLNRARHGSNAVNGGRTVHVLKKRQRATLRRATATPRTTVRELCSSSSDKQPKNTRPGVQRAI